MLKVESSRNLWIKLLQTSSSACAVAGGIVLASNTSISSFGFLFLALSSSQMFVSAYLSQNNSILIYAGSLFIFVDCLGIYRWILS